MMTITKTRRFELTNSFHNTRVTVRVPADRANDGEDYLGRKVCHLRLTAAQAKRADRALCGMSDCTCGGLGRDHYPQPVSGRAGAGADVEVTVAVDSER